MKNWSIWHIYFAGSAVVMICLGIAGIVSAAREPDRATQQATLLEACTNMCGGEVASFEIDWRNQPVCRCR